MVRIAGLASNRGRNLRNVHRLEPGGATLDVVLTNREGAPILDWAGEHDLPSEVVALEEGESRREHERRVIEALADHEFDLVCLDGYMRILSDTFLEAMPTVLNVHPSLLPAFPGDDAWGDALEAGVSVSGCTVHVVVDATDDAGAVVDELVDAGPIVSQEPVPVHPGDDRATLKDRILHEGEFKAYPRAIRWVAEGTLEVAGDVTDPDTVSVAIDGDEPGTFPGRLVQTADKVRALRYGENPHQDAAVYADATVTEANVIAAEQRNPGAKALSYNNYNDADGALNLIKEFDEPAAAVIKHANPAGCAVAGSLAEAYDRALATDAKSAFGGIVALNRDCDAATAESIVESFKEVVVAPGYTADALEVLRTKENLRVLDVGPLGEPTDTIAEKPIVGGRLRQDRDLAEITAEDLEFVTEREPTDAELETMLFAWKVQKHVKSNGIVFATGTETVGLGVGQVSRVDAVEIAARKAERDAEGKSADGAVMGSDAFFPFPDAVEVAAEAGVEAVIQPGGSVNDDDVIEVCDELGVAMALTGTRCFRHD